MAILPMPIDLDYLKKCYDQLIKKADFSLEWLPFQNVLAELEKTVIRTDVYGDGARKMVTFQNPSAKDNILGLLQNNFVQYEKILENSIFAFDQYILFLDVLKNQRDVSQLYEEYMWKAIDAIDTESLGIKDLYGEFWKEESPISKIYRSDFVSQGREKGRWLQLMLYFDAQKSSGVREIIKNKFTHICKALYQYPEHIVRQELELVMDTALKLYGEGVLENIKGILCIYMECIMRNRMPLHLIELNVVCRKEVELYVKENQSSITMYLEKYYDAELCLAAVKNDIDMFYMLYAQMREEWLEFDLSESTWLIGKVEMYETWLEERVEVKSGEEYIDGQQEIEEIYSGFREDYVEDAFPDYIEDVSEWIKCNDEYTEGQKIKAAKIYSSGYFWAKVIKTTDEADFFMKIISKVDKMPEQMVDCVLMIYQYMYEQGELLFHEWCHLFMIMEQADNEYGIISENELLLFCPDFWEEKQGKIENLIQKKILVKIGNWYRIASRWIELAWIIGTVHTLSEAEKIHFYKYIFKHVEGEKCQTYSELEELGRKYAEDCFSRGEIEIFYRTAPEIFRTYILRPLIKEFYLKVRCYEEDDILCEIFNYHEIEIELDINGKMLSTSSIVIDLFEYLDIVYGFSVIDALPECISVDDLNLSKEHIKLKEECICIQLHNIQDINIIKSLDVYDILIEMWEKISNMSKEEDDGR